MAGLGLSGIITGGFIRQFAELAKQTKSGGRAGFKQEEASLGAGLRIGARTFSTALDGLNAATSVVSISKRSLEELKDLTNDLIRITERATLVSSGSETRKSLNVEFKKKASDFRNVVSNATTGGEEFLSKEGLAEVFQSVGLSKENSQAVAQVFSSFVTTSSDDSLASEYVRSSSGGIPVGAFSTRTSDSARRLDKLTNSGISDGAISATNSVFVDEDDILNQNPAFDSLFTVSGVGNVRSLAAGSLTRDIKFLAVDEDSGYAVIESNTNILGYNPTTRRNLFLVDPNGNFVQQLTTNTLAGITYTDAAISSFEGGSDPIVVYNEKNGTSETIARVTVSATGVNPNTLTSQDIESGTSQNFTSLDITDSGNSILFRASASGSEAIYLYDVVGASYNADLLGYTRALDVGFIAENSEHNKTIIGINSNQGKLVSVSHNGAAIYTDIDSGTFGTVAFSGDGYIAANSTSDRTIQMYTTDTSGIFVSKEDLLSYGVGDSITKLSISAGLGGEAYNVGIVGNLGTLSGDSDTELYRLSSNPQAATGPRRDRSTPDLYDEISGEQLNSVFSQDSSIATRAGAYRVLKDLKILKEQIDSNIVALDKAYSAIENNIKLVRTAGKAMLELADQVNSETDADDLASILRAKIRAGGNQAILAQAGNLNAISVAALTLSADD
jgi:hypothetical protein